MNNSSVQTMLGTSVVELTFVRRHVSLGWNNVRGILGTTNPSLLNGPFGKQVVHFRPPNGRGMGYDYRSKQLCVIWDFFRQEFRVFGAEEVHIRQVFDLTDPEKAEEFHTWFNEFIIGMTPDEKLKFMGFEGQSFAIAQKMDIAVRQKAEANLMTRIYQSTKKRLMDLINRKKKS